MLVSKNTLNPNRLMQRLVYAMPAAAVLSFSGCTIEEPPHDDTEAVAVVVYDDGIALPKQRIATITGAIGEYGAKVGCRNDVPITVEIVDGDELLAATNDPTALSHSTPGKISIDSSVTNSGRPEATATLQQEIAIGLGVACRETTSSPITMKLSPFENTIAASGFELRTDILDDSSVAPLHIAASNAIAADVLDGYRAESHPVSAVTSLMQLLLKQSNISTPELAHYLQTSNLNAFMGALRLSESSTDGAILKCVNDGFRAVWDAASSQQQTNLPLVMYDIQNCISSDSPEGATRSK